MANAVVLCVKEISMKKIYWIEDWEGKAKGGLYFRCDLFKWVQKAEESGMKVVGIAIDESWDMELIVEAEVVKN
jgi:hypothetical protein